MLVAPHDGIASDTGHTPAMTSRWFGIRRVLRYQHLTMILRLMPGTGLSASPVVWRLKRAAITPNHDDLRLMPLRPLGGLAIDASYTPTNSR
jgi:hypothetical protein